MKSAIQIKSGWLIEGQKALGWRMTQNIYYCSLWATSKEGNPLLWRQPRTFAHIFVLNSYQISLKVIHLTWILHLYVTHIYPFIIFDRVQGWMAESGSRSSSYGCYRAPHFQGISYIMKVKCSKQKQVVAGDCTAESSHNWPACMKWRLSKSTRCQQPLGRRSPTGRCGDAQQLKAGC